MNDNMEVHGAEHTLNGMEFRLEKSIGNGKSQNESVVGAGGLGQGSPTVRSCDRALVGP